MPLIIPIFIANRGCPHRCIFCNERMIAGDFPEQLSEAVVRDAVQTYLQHSRKKKDIVQIAFYGGNFTGMAEQDQVRLLEYTAPLVESGMVHSVRVSTRPDDIDEDRLALLKSFSVKTVEIGAQSMDDEVLTLSGRGHSARDVIRATGFLKDGGFETGIHLMVGLPGDNRETFDYTVSRIVALKPASVRLHPVLVFRDTELARIYEMGTYLPLSIDTAVTLCKSAVEKFAAAGIPVIRLGLQTTKTMEAPGGVLAGPFHPAFASLVHESIFLEKALSILSVRRISGKSFTFRVSPRDASYLRGQKNRNIEKMKARFDLSHVAVVSDPEQKRGTLLPGIDGSPKAPSCPTLLS